MVRISLKCCDLLKTTRVRLRFGYGVCADSRETGWVSSDPVKGAYYEHENMSYHSHTLPEPIPLPHFPPLLHLSPTLLFGEILP